MACTLLGVRQELFNIDDFSTSIYFGPLGLYNKRSYNFLMHIAQYGPVIFLDHFASCDFGLALKS